MPAPAETSIRPLALVEEPQGPRVTDLTDRNIWDMGERIGAPPAIFGRDIRLQSPGSTAGFSIERAGGRSTGVVKFDSGQPGDKTIKYNPFCSIGLRSVALSEIVAEIVEPEPGSTPGMRMRRSYGLANHGSSIVELPIT